MPNTSSPRISTIPGDAWKTSEEDVFSYLRWNTISNSAPNDTDELEEVQKKSSKAFKSGKPTTSGRLAAQPAFPLAHNSFRSVAIQV